MRRLEPRGPTHLGITVDVEGVTLGSSYPLVRRVAATYECLARDAVAALQAAVFDSINDPDWLFRLSTRIADLLAAGNVALAQIYGLQIARAASPPRVRQWLTRAKYNPDEPRDRQGRWTDSGNPGGEARPLSATGERTDASETVTSFGDDSSDPEQLAADNRRQNKMVRDIVVQLRLSRDERQELHRAISGQDLTYRQILNLAKEMFDK